MFDNIKTYFNSISTLSEHDWSLLEAELSVCHIKKGTYLSQAGEILRVMHFINKGLVRKFYSVNGKEVSIIFFHENEFFCDYASFLTQTPSKENFDALEDCELVSISFLSLQYLYKTSPAFERIGRMIAEKLFIRLANRSTMLLALTPEERYMDMLVNQPFISQRVPQYMIASYIGITPEHLSRIRKKIAQKRLVDKC